MALVFVWNFKWMNWDGEEGDPLTPNFANTKVTYGPTFFYTYMYNLLWNLVIHEAVLVMDGNDQQPIR